MSNSILVSLQNISSSLKSLSDVVKADNFYDTVYCGKYYDRFSVKFSGVMSYMYVIKHRNEHMNRFMSAVDRVSPYSDSPFGRCKVYREELLCYEGKNVGIYRDIVIVDNVDDVSLTKFLMKNSDATLGANVIDVVKSFTSAVLWLFHYKICVDGFCEKSVFVCKKRIRFAITEKTDIKTFNREEWQQYEKYCKELLFAVFASWILLLRADKNYKITDLMLKYLESYSLENITCSFSELVAEIDLKLKSDFGYIVNYVLLNEGDLQGAISCLKKLLEIKESKIEEFQMGAPSSNHYLNSEDYDISYGASENRIIVRDKKTDKFGYINSYGNHVIDCKYDEVTHFSEGIAVVRLDSSYFAIDNNGGRITDESFDAIQWYSDINRFIVHNDGCYKLLNRAGEVISVRDYGWIGEFSFNRAVVESSSDGRKGYIDLDGNEITSISFDDALSFENGVGKVFLEGRWRIVIFDGDIV